MYRCVYLWRGQDVAMHPKCTVLRKYRFATNSGLWLIWKAPGSNPGLSVILFFFSFLFPALRILYGPVAQGPRLHALVSLFFMPPDSMRHGVDTIHHCLLQYLNAVSAARACRRQGNWRTGPELMPTNASQFSSTGSNQIRRIHHRKLMDHFI